MRGLSSKLLLLLLAILFLTASANTIIDHDDNDDDDLEAYLKDGFGEDDVDLDDFDFFNLEIEDINAEGLKDMTLQRGLVLVFYSDRESDRNEEYEKFFKSLAPFINSEALDLELALARIPIEEKSKLSNHFRPSSFPAVVLFDHQRKFEYDGPLELVEFFTWLTPTVAREIIELTDQDSMKEFLEKDDTPKLIAFYSSNDNNEFETLNSLVMGSYLTMLDIRNIASCNENCPNVYNGKTFTRPSLVLFRNIQNMEPIVVLDNHLLTTSEVFNFLALHSTPPVIVFDDVNMTKMFEDVFKGQIILMLDPKADNTEILSEFTKSAYYNIEHEPKEERLIHAVFYNDGENDGIKWFFNVDNVKSFPKVFVTRISNELDKILKFETTKTGPINYTYLRELIDDFRNNNLKRYMISEELPAVVEGKQTLRKLVGSTFQSEVMESDSSQFVVFACDNFDTNPCKDNLKVFETLATKATELGNASQVNLKFAYLDIAKNEVDFEILGEFPQIMLYKPDNKPKGSLYKPFVYSEDELVRWIKESIPTFNSDSKSASIEL